MSGRSVLLLRLARFSLAGRILRWLLAYMSFAIPSKRLRETDTLVAFHHPCPSYLVHLLLVPKRWWRSLTDLQAADTDFLIDLLRTVQSLIADFDLEQNSYRFIAIGGSYQDMPYLPFHLISDTRQD